MLNEQLTYTEQNVGKNIEQNLGTHLKNVTLSKEAFLACIYKKLCEIYGCDRVRWKNHVDNYIKQNQDITTIDNIPELSIEQIRNILVEENLYKEAVLEALDLGEKIHTMSPVSSELGLLYDVAKKLGVYPIYTDNQYVLNRYLVDFTNITRNEVDDIFHVEVNIFNLYLIVKFLLDYYTDGLQVTYSNSIAGTVLTQPKRKFYYRGENAYFGSSKASSYRGFSSYTTFDDVIRHMKYHEAGLFLDNFTAMKKWNVSNVNHMALMQHYGLKTSMIDITSDILVALFFACCKWANGCWKPLEESDFRYKYSRKYISDMGGDSRYAVLYRQPTEIDDMRWGLQLCKDGLNTVIPVGHQPFMRCQVQSAYMLYTNDFTYDLYKDRCFQKFRFRLTAEFCNEIYELLDGGKKIYPQSDIPDISYFLNIIEYSKEIPQKIISDFGENGLIRKRVMNWLCGQGYRIVSARSKFIKQRYIDTISNKYTFEHAMRLAGCKPHCRPMIIIS